MDRTDDPHISISRVASWMATIAGWAEPGEPHQVRGPFARWPRTSDAASVIIVLIASLGAVAVSALGDGEGLTAGSLVDHPQGAIVVLAASAIALWWRRSYPLGVTAVVLGLMLVWAVGGYGDGNDLPLIVALYSVGRFHLDHRRSIGAVAVAATVSWLGTVIDPSQRIDIVPALLVTVLPWYVGRRVRNRGDYVALLQDRTRRLEAEQQARARRAVLDERTRIARELHDVVAHRVSMMTVQAGAAKTIARHDLDAAIEAMGDTERAGRQALGELRHLLGVLRPDDDGDGGRLEPHPGLADLPALVDELRPTGLRIDLTIDEVPDPIPAPVDLAAYRIVQESLTNVVKHAGPAPEVDVGLTVVDDRLVLTVTNTTADPPERLPAFGYGIAGMTERAASLGGCLTARAEAPDRFRVVAHLPVDPRRA